jgi:transposase
MANKNIIMSKLRQILKMYFYKTGTRKISERTGVSRTTVIKYLERYRSMRTTWDELSVLSDQNLDALFHQEPAAEPTEQEKELYAFFPYAEKQLKYPGITLNKLWKEYFVLYPEGYQSTAFYKHYNRYKHRSHPSMHMTHKAGDKMFVDYAGEKLEVIDTTTGEIKKVEVFVAILGASQLTYVEAVESQSMEDFILCSENALHFFGGSPSAIVPDNLKSAVTKTSKYEPQINENFEAFADHYGMAVVPARAYKPKDKALVEGAVKITYNRIYANIREQEFTSVHLLNEAIRLHLQNHNQLNFSGRKYSRQQQFDEMEKQVLQPLPQMRYEMRKDVTITVMLNGYVRLHCDKHYYSVPYKHIGKKVKLFYSKSKIEIYYKYEQIASHQRNKSPHNYTTEKAHMASTHQFMTDRNPAFYIEAGNKINEAVGLYIEQVLERKKYPEQGYRSCQGILSFAKRYGEGRLTNACKRAHEVGYFNFKIIENILQKNLDQYEQEEQTPPMPSHENIRGQEYYK